MKEGGGLSSGGGIVGLVKRPPHPNAARVFVNWFLSREGQIALQIDYAKLGALGNSLRIDIPKDVIPREMRLTEGIPYIDVDIPERMSMEPMVKMVNEGLTQAGK
jgi:iron(III) transport system substrate-binding protein